jgi:competence protein ComEC
LGVCAVAPWIAARLHGPTWWRTPLAVTLGAQVGVAVPSVLVFHRLPVISVPANLVAVPVAGAVMLYGLPAGVAGGVLPPLLTRVLMWPAALGTRWVALVAQLAARLEPGVGWDIVGWVGIVVGLVLWRAVHSRASPANVPS